VLWYGLREPITRTSQTRITHDPHSDGEDTVHDGVGDEIEHDRSLDEQVKEQAGHVADTERQTHESEVHNASLVSTECAQVRAEPSTENTLPEASEQVGNHLLDIIHDLDIGPAGVVDLAIPGFEAVVQLTVLEGQEDAMTVDAALHDAIRRDVPHHLLVDSEVIVLPLQAVCDRVGESDVATLIVVVAEEEVGSVGVEGRDHGRTPW